jgi:hypothetical protein
VGAPPLELLDEAALLDEAVELLLAALLDAALEAPPLDAAVELLPATLLDAVLELVVGAPPTPAVDELGPEPPRQASAHEAWRHRLNAVSSWLLSHTFGSTTLLTQLRQLGSSPQAFPSSQQRALTQAAQSGSLELTPQARDPLPVVPTSQPAPVVAPPWPVVSCTGVLVAQAAASPTATRKEAWRPRMARQERS